MARSTTEEPVMNSRMRDFCYPGLRDRERAAVDQFVAETDDGLRLDWLTLRRLRNLVDPPGCSQDMSEILCSYALQLLERLHGEPEGQGDEWEPTYLTVGEARFHVHVHGVFEQGYPVDEHEEPILYEAHCVEVPTAEGTGRTYDAALVVLADSVRRALGVEVAT